MLWASQDINQAIKGQLRIRLDLSAKIALKIIFSMAVFGALFSGFSFPAHAQIEIRDADPEDVEVGEGAAQKYFKTRKSNSPPKSPAVSYDRGPTSTSERFLALSLGTFFNDRSYSWGSRGQDDVGSFNAGVSYRVGEWVNSMDLLFRMEYQGFKLDEGRASKLSFLPIVTFPDVNSQFPLYFGGGAGLGVFLTQIRGESHLSFDYQVLAGARIMDLSQGFGLMAEIGIKNHVLLLSDGQFNSVSFSVGGIFQF